MRKSKVISFCLPLSMVLALMTACGTGNNTGNDSGNGKTAEEKPKAEAKKDPYSMLIFAAGVSKEEFDKRFRGVLEKKFPHITFNYQTSGTGNNITDLVTRGEIPDLIRTDIPTLRTGYLDLNLGVDLTPYVTKYKYDLNRFNPVFIQEIKDYTRDGKLFGLPVPPFFPNVLYYNKDLFDKFGVPYPKDGMTWDEAYDLSKKMTRTDGGKQIRGFSANLTGMLRDNPFSQAILDPEKDGLTDQDKWTKVFSNLKRFYDVQGNEYPKTAADDMNMFGKGEAALSANLHSVYLVIPPEINWDIVSLPTMEGAPKRVSQRGPAYWSISETSKHKDEAFEVIMEMLKDEIQMEDSKQGIPTTLNNKDIQNALGSEHAIYKTKNMKAVSFYPPTDPTPKRKPGLVDVPLASQQSAVSTAFVDYVSGKTDLNTALRQLDEKLKQLVEEEKAKKK
ncbi:ABC transporter substrate-binding protein [Paenibacillus ginsengarvi]|uniref:Extracellular solute-binding protein n=1 Tax=Paenibacillus ginsengarvi TaxID=400777 RepID=A0A3B0BIJ6_9BACL|nr:extracellular solute-binding protein [Paenibacillus ginsengarvi]RKN71899.1 extracellular solute-binding protein [Paenibacillus ginsengarvi]